MSHSSQGTPVKALHSRHSSRGAPVEALQSRHSSRGAPVGALQPKHSNQRTPVDALQSTHSSQCTLVETLYLVNAVRQHICDSCQRAKVIKTYNREPQKRAQQPYQFIHTDLVGPINSVGFLSEQYFFTS